MKRLILLIAIIATFGIASAQVPETAIKDGSILARVASNETITGNWTFAGTTIANLGTVTTVDINGGTIDGTVIGGASAAAITGTTIVGSTSVSTPSLITASGALTITPAAGSNLNVDLSTTGDFAVNTSQLYVDTSTGNVGIGTTAPANPLSITTSSAAANNLGLLELKGGSTDGAYFSFYEPGQKAWSIGIDDGASTLNFKEDSLVGTARLSIIAGGNVGIGTASPSAQTHIVAGAAGTVGLRVDTAASATAVAQSWTYNGATRARLGATATSDYFTLDGADYGNNVSGSYVNVGRNTNAGAEGPASGYYRIVRADGGALYLWVDASTDLRIHTAPPTGSSGTPTIADNAGTVVGTQTSWHELKSNINKVVDYQEALDRVLATDVYSYDMNGDHRDYGLVIYPKDIGSWYSYNDDLSKGQIPSLDDREIIGTLVASIKALEARITALEGK